VCLTGSSRAPTDVRSNQRVYSSERGRIERTVGLFAYCIDRDHDTNKAGRALNGAASATVETSVGTGNTQQWIALSRALSPDVAKPLGELIRKSVGADHATGNIVQPYRVPGTPNYPDAKKRARGRTVVATKLIAISDRLWGPAEIETEFSTAKTQPEKAQPRRKAAGALKQNGCLCGNHSQHGISMRAWSAPSHRRARYSQQHHATGGLLRQIGDRGILAIKDFTSIISANREVRMQVLAALREIHDGHWIRNVGSDGGQSLEWRGRLVVIGACTTVYDQAHAVVSIMGDRFVLVRADSTTGRIAAGIQAIRNTGTETVMRRELAEAVAGLISQVPPDCPCDLSGKEIDSILTAADIVTLARTAVETDYRGNIIDAHAPEMPTRFAKQLTQVMRGGVAIGMSRAEAMASAIRCARNSMPPLRLAILEDIAANPGSRIVDVRRRLQRPRATADRALQALHVLGLLICDEEEQQRDDGPHYVRHYRLSQGVKLGVLGVTKNVSR
jgi:hypothetical protein